MRTSIPLVLLSTLAAAAAACSSDDGDPMGPGCDDVFYGDADGDGFGDPDAEMTACEAPAGFVVNSDDCDDGDAEVNPTAGEVCDGRDNDCDALVDTADPSVDATSQRPYFRDSDGDGFGDPADSTVACDRPVGYVVDDTDCDDAASGVNPGASEVCDDVDNDCDSLVDAADDSLDPTTAGTYFLDEDGDGFGAGDGQVACGRPFGFAEQGGDCDDGAADTHPDATELCTGRDNDCDGGIDGTAGDPDQCDALEGTYSSGYTHSAVEKLGATIINQMHCVGGSTSLTLSLAQDPPLQGTASCTYPGGLTLFDDHQTAVIEASVALDGSVSGTLVHRYNFDLSRTYSFGGSLSGDAVDVVGEGSMKPHPMSAVPWEVDFTMLPAGP